MTRAEYISLIKVTTDQGGTIRDLKRRQPNYSREVVAHKLEVVSNRGKKRKKKI